MSAERGQVKGAPSVLTSVEVARYRDQRILVITPHGDDAPIFAGGTIAALSACGADVVMARFSDDATDSADLSPSETIDRNRQETQAAAKILGIREIRHLDYPSDHLTDIPRTELRERVIRLFREIRPYAVFTFDPYSAFGEDNQDHCRLADAVDEAFWTAMFTKHHPEHFDAGLKPHGVVERWYFGRRLTEVDVVVDISPFIDVKTTALMEHSTMMDNLRHQLTLMAQTAGLEIEARESFADLQSLINDLVHTSSEKAGRPYGLKYAEEYRVVRFAGFDELFSTLEQP